MGYTTEFMGTLHFVTPLTFDEESYLCSLFGEDRRDHPEWHAPHDFTYIDLELSPDGNGITWDGSEKTYGMVEMINWLIQHMRDVIMPQFGLRGELLAQGEDMTDRWVLVINEAGFAEKRHTTERTHCPHCGNRLVV